MKEMGWTFDDVSKLNMDQFHFILESLNRKYREEKSRARRGGRRGRL